MFGGRDSSRSTCGCLSCSSAASSIVTMRSSSGMKPERTFRVVVLPLPVPPLIRMFIRPRTQASSRSRTDWVSVPKPTRSSAVYGSAANLRIVSMAPSSAIGAMTAFTRDPSCSLASTIGLASSTRRPTRPTILSMVRRRCTSLAKLASTGKIRPKRST